MRDTVVKFILGNQVLSALIIVATAWLVIEIKEVLITIFVSYIVMTAISPYVDFLEEKRVPKVLAVVIPYLVALAFAFLIIISLLPFFISQIQVLIDRLPGYLNS